MPSVDEINHTLETQAPVLYRCLSPLGRRAFYPPDIPFQAMEARGTTYNGTIGIFTDGHGRAVPLPSMAAAVRLADEDLSKAFLYSPISGIPELRERWRAWQRRGEDARDALPSSLPLVLDGLSHGLSMAAELFGGEGRVVAIPTPFWGNYRQVFTMRTGAEVRSTPWIRDGRFHPEAVREALAGVPAGEPVCVLLNFPSNPGGYSPAAPERRALVASLLELADRHPLVAILDEAYQGYVYDDEVPRGSLYWELVGRHEQLVPVKIDGATKEFSFFGGRVAFITFPYAPDSPVAKALENKVNSLLRSSVGSPVALGQIILLQALRSGRAEEEIAEVYRLSRERYEILRPLLDRLDPALLRPLPFNAGFFALLELPAELGLTSEEVRLHLLRNHDTGVVAIKPNFVRLAICSVAPEAIPELVARVERGVRELASVAA